MKKEIVSVTKKRHTHLKASEKVEWDVVGEFKQALEDLKKGNYKDC